jgi:hypothetical protein
MGLKLAAGLTLDNGLRPQAIAGVAPALDYRFARDKREIEAISLTDKLTYTGGNGTFVGSDGYIQRATTNVPRFDHDPVTRVSEGLLVEVERTNSITNNTMVGAVPGTPGTRPTGWSYIAGSGGLTVQIIGTGVEEGISYIDVRFYGTTTNTNSIALGIGTGTATTGQTWTGSTYWKLTAGSLVGITASQIGLIELTSGAAFVTGAFYTVSNPTAASLASQRVNASRTLSGGATVGLCQFVIHYVVSNATAIDATFRIGFPQLEQGATASTPIPTTSTAVTRTADSAVIDGTGVLTGTYTMVEKPAGCAIESGGNIVLQAGYTAERVMVFPAALSAQQITDIRSAM